MLYALWDYIKTTSNLFTINWILNDIKKIKSYTSFNWEILNTFICRFEEIIIKVNKWDELSIEEYKIIELFKTRKLELDWKRDTFKKEKFFISYILEFLSEEKKLFQDFIDDLYSKAKKPEWYIPNEWTWKTISSIDELFTDSRFFHLDLWKTIKEVKDWISTNI